MAIEIKILFTVVFLGLITVVFFIDPKNPGPTRLWRGNKRLLRTVANNGTLKKSAKPFLIILFLIFFGMCIYLLWFGA